MGPRATAGRLDQSERPAVRARQREEGRELEFLRDSSGIGGAPKIERSTTTSHSVLCLFERFTRYDHDFPDKNVMKYVDVRG